MIHYKLDMHANFETNNENNKQQQKYLNNVVEG